MATEPTIHVAPIAVFDINETTLDLAPVREAVDELLGEEGGFRVWFTRLLQLSMTCTAINQFIDFSTLARHAGDATAATGGRTISDEDWSSVVTAFGRLKAHPDVVDGLTALRAGGWMTVALTNSTTDAVTAQLTNAGIAQLFDRILSVESVRTYKPATAPYLYASAVVGAAPSRMWMVACHDWDLAGANAAGLLTAFVRRDGMSYAPTFPEPKLNVADFGELAERLLDEDTLPAWNQSAEE
ncbi:MAG: haloacid dehalogenase type II [Actinomycetota bacterium]